MAMGAAWELYEIIIANKGVKTPTDPRWACTSERYRQMFGEGVVHLCGESIKT